MFWKLSTSIKNMFVNTFVTNAAEGNFPYLMPISRFATFAAVSIAFLYYGKRAIGEKDDDEEIKEVCNIVRSHRYYLTLYYADQLNRKKRLMALTRKHRRQGRRRVASAPGTGPRPSNTRRGESDYAMPAISKSSFDLGSFNHVFMNVDDFDNFEQTNLLISRMYGNVDHKTRNRQ